MTGISSGASMARNIWIVAGKEQVVKTEDDQTFIIKTEDDLFS